MMFDVPVGKRDALGKVDDTLEEGATWGNYQHANWRGPIRD